MVNRNVTTRTTAKRSRTGQALLGLASLLLPVLVAGQLFGGCGGPPPPKTAGKAKAKAKAPAKAVKVKPAKPDEVKPACADHDKALAEEFAPYVDAFSNVGEEISPDGQTLLFRSNRGGGSLQLNVCSMKKLKADPVIIAEGKDGVAGTRFSPDGKYILFTRDKDRNENTQIFRATVDGKEVKALTEALDSFHHLPLVTDDSKTLFYFRGTHKSGETTLVSQSIDGGEAKAIFKGKGFMFLTDITRDGSKALVVNLKSMSESTLSLVDLKSGEAKLLFPPKGKKGHAHMSAFSADEKSVYVVSDVDVMVAGLTQIDLATGEAKATFNDYEGETGDVRVSEKTPFVAVMLDFGSHHALRLLDAATLEEKVKVVLPNGSLRLGRFTADGQNLLITLSTPDQPTDMFLVDTKKGKLKMLRSDKRPGLTKLAKVQTAKELVKTFDATFKVHTNIYLPQRLPKGKKLPVIVSLHGGPAAAASFGWDPMLSFWVSRGFAVVEPNVRGSTGFGKEYEKADNGRKRMDALKDLAEVNAWIRTQEWADTERMIVFGGSYGGYMVYMALGHQPELWHAGIGLVGIVNLRTFLASTTGAIQMAFRDEFGELPKDGKFLDSISPIKVIKKMKAPLFVYQGQNDPRVPRSEQDQLVTALRARKVSVEYMVAADEGHSLSQRANKLEFVSRSTRFLEQHLDLPGPPADCKTHTPASPEAKKPEAKKPEPEPAEAKKPEAKKPEPEAKKPEPEAKKPEPEGKKPEPEPAKVEPKTVEKKAPAKKAPGAK